MTSPMRSCFLSFPRATPSYFSSDKDETSWYKHISGFTELDFVLLFMSPKEDDVLYMTQEIIFSHLSVNPSVYPSISSPLKGLKRAGLGRPKWVLRGLEWVGSALNVVRRE